MKNKKTNQEFREELDAKVPNWRELYPNLSPYINSKTKLSFDHKWGKCAILPNSLLKNVKVQISSAVNKNDFFRNQLFDTHPDLKESIWGLSKYTSIFDIIYFNTKYGKCRNVARNLLLYGTFCIQNAVNKNQFLHNMLWYKNSNYTDNFIVIGGYVKYHQKIKILTVNGVCEMLPLNLLKGTLPDTQSAVNKTEYCINEFHQIHEVGRYDYSKFEYTNAKEKSIIICPIEGHGEFLQTPNRHKSRTGCPKCGYELNGWGKWKKGCKSKSQNPIFYSIRCWNGTEEFYKVGITGIFGGVSKRYDTKYKLPYNYEIVQEIHGTCQQVWNFEVQMKRTLHGIGSHYVPKIKFGGHKTECFKIK